MAENRQLEDAMSFAFRLYRALLLHALEHCPAEMSRQQLEHALWYSNELELGRDGDA